MTAEFSIRLLSTDRVGNARCSDVAVSEKLRCFDRVPNALLTSAAQVVVASRRNELQHRHVLTGLYPSMVVGAHIEQSATLTTLGAVDTRTIMKVSGLRRTSLRARNRQRIRIR